MKWVKVAIGAVIAIISIGIIATSVYDMTQETVRDEVVTFEVLTESTVTSGTYNLLLEYSELNGINVSNVIIIYLNDIEFNTVFNYDSDTNQFGFYDSTVDDSDFIEIGDSIQLITGLLDIGDIVEITFEVPAPPQLTGITATLILLTPLIFAGGVLAYLLNKQEL